MVVNNNEKIRVYIYISISLKRFCSTPKNILFLQSSYYEFPLELSILRFLVFIKNSVRNQHKLKTEKFKFDLVKKCEAKIRYRRKYAHLEISLKWLFFLVLWDVFENGSISIKIPSLFALMLNNFPRAKWRFCVWEREMR